jgi:outer membrane receptor protein involved in Fe transport
VSTLGRFDFGVEAPSTELEPETSTSYELGFKSTGSRGATALAVYRTNLADLIERVPSEYQGSSFYEGQRVYRRSNVGLAYVWGVEAELQARLARDLLAFGSATYTYGQQVTAAEPMRRIPPLFGQAGIRFDPPRGLSLGAAVLLAGRQDRLASGDKADHRIDPNGTPGYGVVNVDAGYGFGPKLELRGGVENVFDEAYRVHGSGVDGAGRYFWIGAAVRF